MLIDMSIHTAYVKAIRTAQHFIYIENQYFLGSSFNWDSYKDLGKSIYHFVRQRMIFLGVLEIFVMMGRFLRISGANNLIPIEIALKIAEKIKAGERFSAYIVIPMWPEGIPSSNPIQRILFWQVMLI